MELEITPEPNPEEREALLAALAALLDGDRRPAAYRSAWRELGIRDNLGEGDGEESGRDGTAAQQARREPRVVEP